MQITRERNLAQARVAELEEEIVRLKSSAIASKAAHDQREAKLSIVLKAAQRETITMQEMAVEEKKGAAKARKQAEVQSTPSSTARKIANRSHSVSEHTLYRLPQPHIHSASVLYHSALMCTGS